MEQWKTIKGYDDYLISNMGNIYSKYLGRNMKPSPSKNRYLKIILGSDGIYKTFLVHRLVMLSFIENPENKRCVNHINGIKNDNRLCNLEWNTHSENLLHSISIGTAVYPKGEDHSSVKLNKSDVLSIRDKISNKNNTVKELSLEYNVCIDTIYKVKNRIYWKHI